MKKLSNRLQDAPEMQGRRKFLLTGAGVAAASVLPPLTFAAGNNTSKSQNISGPSSLERRKLGTLEVSSIGLGVQNFARKYDTRVPYRPEVINVIREAFDNGVTFFDTAEAYGPFECERILGEAIKSFRDQVVITSKFGWDIDPKTGVRRSRQVNSRPKQIKAAVEGMLKRLNTDRIDLLYQHRVDPNVPIEDVAGVVNN